MKSEEDVLSMDIWKDRIQQDISDLKNNQTHLKSEQEKLKNDVHQLQVSDRLQDQEIQTLKDALGEIKDDLNWIKRKITGAIISGIIVAIVGGIVGIAVTTIYGGIK
ncbi:MAG TPA: hemolysin XhlA family protein [Candidatus Nitrosocosmicus sp.]|nr:hemolysin XhlA family protein [Candidatus Nitrosocosmicus sp.]